MSERIWVVMSTSHWQGARHYPVAVAPDEATADRVADLMSTCSFCRPGRAGQYQTGSCYSAKWMRVRPSVPTLPDHAVEWSRADVDAWFERDREAAEE